ncbi:helix-turn-helix domain-containing protein [Aquicoccus sp. SCR17]|nr:helix-turn-helix domain-containing protein [Carideicomes alvinocaridis]
MIEPTECRLCCLPGARLCRVIRQKARLSHEAQNGHRHASRDETLYETGTRPGLIGILRKGFLRRERLMRDGRRTVLGLVGPGGVVGEMPGRIASYSLEAATACDICLFPAGFANRLATAEPDLRRAIADDLAEQYDLELTFAWLRGISRCGDRVTAFLVLASELMPSAFQPDGSVILKIPLARRDWADLCNTTVESVSRQLSDLSARGLVESLGGKRYRLPDLAALRASAGLDQGLLWRGRRARMTAVNATPLSAVSSPRHRTQAIRAAADVMRGVSEDGKGRNASRCETRADRGAGDATLR